MKIRLDQYLVQHGLIQSRERAKAMIMSGVVFVNEQKVDKAGEMIQEDAKVEVRGHDIGYVSRGGLKLEKATQVAQKSNTTGLPSARIDSKLLSLTLSAIVSCFFNYYATQI